MAEFEGRVRALSQKGLGVVDHPDGRVFFVRGTWTGDEGIFSLDANQPSYSEIRLKRLVVSSDDRVDVPCPHRGSRPGQCGGCPWMIASYPAQLNRKVERLVHALQKRRVPFSPSALKEIRGAPAIWGYRNRAQFKTDGRHIGYVSEGSSQLAPVEDCLVLNSELRGLLHELRGRLPDESLSPGEGHRWSYLDLDDEMSIDEMVLNKRRPFRQGNSAQNEVMQTWLQDSLTSLPRHYPVIDLFCGSGNFTRVLSEMGFENILAVEVQGGALQKLRDAELNGVRILALDMMEKGSWAKVARLQPHARAMVIDPPREGLSKRRGLFKYLDNLECLIYISCELDTFARDAAEIIKNGWWLEELSPIDLFPHTPHIEIMSIFRRT